MPTSAEETTTLKQEQTTSEMKSQNVNNFQNIKNDNSKDRMWRLYIFSALIKIVLFLIGTSSTLGDHMELNTPITSYLRLKEACFLDSIGASAYSGKLFMQPPLVLFLLKPFVYTIPQSFDQFSKDLQHFSGLDLKSFVPSTVALSNDNSNASTAKQHSYEQLPFLIFLILIDIMIAKMLYRTAHFYRGSLKSKKLVGPVVVAAVYLFNPLTIAGTVALSFQNIHILSLAWVLVSAAKRQIKKCAFALAVALHLMPIGPLFFILPCAWLTFVPLSECKERQDKKLKYFEPGIISHVVRFTFCFVLSLGILMTVSFNLNYHSWDFVQVCYTDVLTMIDLTPTVSSFWYVFTLLFLRFKMMFLVVFHGSPIFFVYPMFVFLGRYLPFGPLAYLIIMMSIYCTFRCYPTASDFAFTLSILLIHSDFVAMVHQRFVFAAAVAVQGLLIIPVMFYLWIGRNTGNPNFVYFSWLTFHVASGVMLSEWVSGGYKLRKAGKKALSGGVREVAEEPSGSKKD